MSASEFHITMIGTWPKPDRKRWVRTLEELRALGVPVSVALQRHNTEDKCLVAVPTPTSQHYIQLQMPVNDEDYFEFYWVMVDTCTCGNCEDDGFVADLCIRHQLDPETHDAMRNTLAELDIPFAALGPNLLGVCMVR